MSVTRQFSQSGSTIVPTVRRGGCRIVGLFKAVRQRLCNGQFEARDTQATAADSHAWVGKHTTLTTLLSILAASEISEAGMLDELSLLAVESCLVNHMTGYGQS